MAFKLPAAINNFLASKGLGTVLDALQFVPIPIVGAVAKTIDTIKDKIVEHPEFQKLSAEDQKSFLEMYEAETARMKQADEAALQKEQARLNDVANARAREIAIANLSKKDWMMKAAGCVGLGSFLVLVYAIIFVKIPVENKDLFNIVAGGIIGVATTIFGYYYGSSKGSADKTEVLKQVVQ